MITRSPGRPALAQSAADVLLARVPHTSTTGLLDDADDLVADAMLTVSSAELARRSSRPTTRRPITTLIFDLFAARVGYSQIGVRET